MSCCTTTVPNSVRKSAPVGQTSRQPACVQCLQTSELISQRRTSALPSSSTRCGSACATNCPCRQVSDPRSFVLSYDQPVSSCPSAGTRFHSLQATSQA